jgi:murein DD-endopeptidase MepM/ murein hydrolase activator NlpD
MRKPFDGDYPITQAFGIISVTGKTHTGVDYAIPTGVPIHACEQGVVTYINKNQPDTGNAVEYKSTDGTRVWRSLHLSSFNVEVGQHFDEGWVIGYSGNTGLSTGPHLHQDVKVNGVFQDPEKMYGESMATEQFIKLAYNAGLFRDVKNQSEIDQFANQEDVAVLNTIIASDEHKGLQFKAADYDRLKAELNNQDKYKRVEVYIKE